MFSEASGAQKDALFGYVFFSVENDVRFEIVKITLVFIVFSRMRFLICHHKIHVFFEIAPSLPKTPPKPKISIFHYTYAHLDPPKKCF